MHIDPCAEQQVGRRRLFWATRSGACGDYMDCGVFCSLPGLKYVERPEGRSIETEDSLDTLILNILNTRARTDTKCPSPSGVYGHWSESYRTDNLYVGSTLWNAADKPYVRVNDSVNAVGAAVRADLGKLIAMGLAVKVDVSAKDGGRGRVTVVVVVTTSTGNRRIDLAGSFVSGTWVWQ